MINRIPNSETKRFTISYIGDFLGDFIHTYNLDLFTRGLAKIGRKIYPHSITSIDTAYAFHKAKISDGTDRVSKLWAIAGDKILRSEDDAEFQEEATTGFEEGEELSTNSDILSIGEQGFDPALAIEAHDDVIQIGGGGLDEKISQSIESGIRFNKLYLKLQNTGADTGYNIKVTIQGVTTETPDLDATIDAIQYNRDVPDGEIYATKIIDAPGNTMEEVEVDFGEEVDSDDSRCVVIEAETSFDTDQSLNVVISDFGDVYENGMASYYFAGYSTQEPYKYTSGATSYTETNDVALVFQTETKDGEDVQNDIFVNFKVEPQGTTQVWSVWIGKNEGSISPIEVNIYAIDGTTLLKTSTSNNVTSSDITPTDNVIVRAKISPSAGFESTDDLKLELGALDTEDNPISLTISRDNVDDTYPYVYFEDETLLEDIYAKFVLSEKEKIYITTGRDVKHIEEEGGEWQSLWKGTLEKMDLNEGYPAILKHLGAGGTLFLANNNFVHTMIATATDSTESEENKIIFDSSYYINWVGVTSSAIFGGLRHKESDILPSQIFYYEPFSERVRLFTIKEGATMGFIMNENCHIIDKKGQMRAFTGSVFSVYDYFPPYYRGERIEKLPHRNGISAVGDVLKIAWEGQYPDPAGIWEYQDGNLYHKHSLVFDKENLNSLGAIELDELGAIYEEDEIYVGASVIDGTESEIKGIYSTIKTTVSDETRASVITSKFTSPEINNIWQDIAIKYRDGTFIIKQKTDPDGVTEGSGADSYTGTWTDVNTFTSDTANFVTAVDDEDIKVGDEIIIRKGQGAGLIAHIESITGTTTKTVVIDDGIGVTSGIFNFSCERWQKINPNYISNRLSARASLKDQQLENAQFKIDMRGTLEEIQVQSINNDTIQKR